ncbi:MAG: hypothetical protein RLZZ15_394 [Verrucomicrobiota bacterium]|jgi:hypothetical protein
MKKLALALVSLAGAALGRAHPGHEALATVPAPAVASTVSITVEGGVRIIRANGVPDHPTGPFPGRGNPNRIAPQRHEFRVTTTPAVAARPTPIGMNVFGGALNGVVFDPPAAEWWRDDRSSGWQFEALGGGRNLGIDAEHAHVQPTGAYHYHGLPAALLARLTDGAPRLTLVGWAGDGFPIYGPWIPRDAADPQSPLARAKSSYRLKTAERASGPGGKPDGAFTADWKYAAGTGDLDECNGRTGPTPEFPQGTYYYVLTEDFPFVPRQWRGTPDASFVKRDGPGGGPPGGPGGAGKKKKRGPQECGARWGGRGSPLLSRQVRRSLDPFHPPK